MFGPKPPIARQHCRHYSYVLPITDPNAGAHCAVGIDLSAPGAAFVCMPGKAETRCPCPKRQEWTEQERETWRAWQEAGQVRMLAAIGALPSLDAFGAATVECPNCKGLLRYRRTRRRAYVRCETEHCVRFEAALRDGPWPSDVD